MEITNDLFDDTASKEILPGCVRIPYLLPENFEVYAIGNLVTISPKYAFEAKVLPTFNEYFGVDGGYVAVYTKDAKQGVYSVGDGVYVMGQIRVPGKYEGTTFVPRGLEKSEDITRDPDLLKLCNQYFPEVEGEMWVGGDTGRWFGPDGFPLPSN